MMDWRVGIVYANGNVCASNGYKSIQCQERAITLYIYIRGANTRYTLEHR